MALEPTITLVDSNVLLDIATDDPVWANWSLDAPSLSSQRENPSRAWSWARGGNWRHRIAPIVTGTTKV